MSRKGGCHCGDKPKDGQRPVLAVLPSCRLAVSPSHRAVSLQQDLAADDASWAIDDAQDRSRGDTLAAAALADDPECPARKNVEAGAIDRLDQSIILEEVRL